jgi:hypothetical protein
MCVRKLSKNVAHVRCMCERATHLTVTYSKLIGHTVNRIYFVLIEIDRDLFLGLKIVCLRQFSLHFYSSIDHFSSSPAFLSYVSSAFSIPFFLFPSLFPKALLYLYSVYLLRNFSSFLLT